MPECEICGGVVETLNECGRCGASFCSECGSAARKLCMGCIDELEEAWE